MLLEITPTIKNEQYDSVNIMLGYICLYLRAHVKHHSGFL